MLNADALWFPSDRKRPAALSTAHALPCRALLSRCACRAHGHAHAPLQPTTAMTSNKLVILLSSLPWSFNCSSHQGLRRSWPDPSQVFHSSVASLDVQATHCSLSVIPGHALGRPLHAEVALRLRTPEAVRATANDLVWLQQQAARGASLPRPARAQAKQMHTL
jgi:hypothetical protein